MSVKDEWAEDRHALPRIEGVEYIEPSAAIILNRVLTRTRCLEVLGLHEAQDLLWVEIANVIYYCHAR